MVLNNIISDHNILLDNDNYKHNAHWTSTAECGSSESFWMEPYFSTMDSPVCWGDSFLCIQTDIYYFIWNKHIFNNSPETHSRHFVLSEHIFFAVKS